MRIVKNMEPKFVIKIKTEKNSISASALKRCLKDAGRLAMMKK